MNASVSFPPHPELDLLGVTLAGEVSVRDGGATALRLGEWHAVYVPGAGVELCAGERGARLIMALASGTASVLEAIPTANAHVRRASWSKRPGAIEVANLSRAEQLIWGEGAFVARIAFGGAGKHVRRASLELLQAAKHASIPEHDHATWEHIAILKGAGKMKLDGLELDVVPGALFQIPPRTRHAFNGSGQQELVAIQLYTPSGPEQRFVMLANQRGPR